MAAPPRSQQRPKLVRLVSNHRARQQPRGIQNERQLRTHMNEGSKQRIQESERGHGNSHTVDGQCANEVLHDDSATAADPRNFPSSAKESEKVSAVSNQR